MNSHRIYHRESAGFAPSGFIELLLLSYIVAAVVNLVLGNWIIGTAMLALLAALFFWTRYIDRQSRCKIGDHVRVSMGPHAGKEGVIVAANESGTRLTVQLSAAELSEAMDFSAYQITNMNPQSRAL